MKKKVIFLGGPTASGKSALALALAEQARGVIINADSMQVYDALRIITARPSVEDEARVPHVLYGYRPASPACSAADWAADATRAIDEADLPIVTGGTGLYFRTLIDGISPIPDIPDAIRADIRSRMELEGAFALHRELDARDPIIAARLEPGDSQRIARALEVLTATGRPLSDWQREPNQGGLRNRTDLDLVCLALTPPRAELYERCDRRLALMMSEGGGLAEIKALMAQNLDPALPVMKALGVPEFIRHLSGNLSYEDALTFGQTATRQYAKRQLTWFRNQFSDWVSGDAQHLESFMAEIYSFIRF
ncbi:tRNA (adenosine(37)-N6)-dimethylallyltransferase MiaA [Govanella unica]|uniref:tRNA dimethylallyltransferase n=1 Tax=Govanella unica TaxID=2975056 RepID=A0A9X3Z6U5_9PROT|nr:tRNA (adenosine(37)-N6)-dimethylallyltransferase MiaA [Govania unica]MDA5193486.1 tRNA (adenosine(37)-N6)-dimethylallyltransferase MiaA [Govania unica]